MPSKKQRRANKLQANSHNGRTSGNRSSSFGWNLVGNYHNSNTNIDYWDSAGYPKRLNFGDLWNMQARFGIAYAGIHKIVNKCWITPPLITDGENDGVRELTAFEKDVKELIDDHAFFSRFKGADWRQRVGRYAAILPIVREQNPGQSDEEITKVNGIKALLKLVPKFESQVDVTSVGTNTDINSIDYGMPSHYNLRENVNGDRNPIDNQQIQLHPSRVFILAEGADDGSIFGIPANEAGFNSLMDLEIICASGQTGLRKNAKMRFVTNVNDTKIANNLLDGKFKALYDESVDNFNRGDSPNLTLYGMDITSLQATLADPTAPFTNSLNAYAASIETPASELLGVQMNKQASVGNETAFNKTAASRRENFLTPSLISFLKYLIKIGVVSEPSDEILITWDELQESTKNEKLDLSKKMSDINKVVFDSGRNDPVYSNSEIRIAGGDEAEPEGDLESFGEDDEDDEDDLNA